MGSESDLSNKQKGINPMPDPFRPDIVTTLLFGISHDQSTLFLSAEWQRRSHAEVSLPGRGFDPRSSRLIEASTTKSKNGLHNL